MTPTVTPNSTPPRRVPSKSKRLPPPAPDHVWYKWSCSGHFLGDDPSNWRKSSNDLGERPPRYLVKRKQKRRPRPSSSAGSIHFNGYQWICPACGRTCRTIYFPLPRLNLLDLVDPAQRISPSPLPRLAQIIDIPPSLPLPLRESFRQGMTGNCVESSDILPLPLRESFRGGEG